ncbi:uncharacterized protein LOC122738572 [Dromiciops gliroides]|uniref:uncharacterized protein LOC122738572 n=1 Tax=Dromiciops gliroides TaxID=33562 RepID=UPI001CC50F92|nr:uncharacterized protein LOC122738572 [Dromiciops gliroides]
MHTWHRTTPSEDSNAKRLGPELRDEVNCGRASGCARVCTPGHACALQNRKPESAPEDVFPGKEAACRTRRPRRTALGFPGCLARRKDQRRRSRGSNLSFAPVCPSSLPPPLSLGKLHSDPQPYTGDRSIPLLNHPWSLYTVTYGEGEEGGENARVSEIHDTVRQGWLWKVVPRLFLLHFLLSSCIRSLHSHSPLPSLFLNVKKKVQTLIKKRKY